MSDINNSCSPSDCASCSQNCGGGNTEHSTITLTLDDNTEVECAILTTFPVKNKKYIALLPLDENGQPLNGEVYLYTFEFTESGDPLLSNIETDEEYDEAAKVFNMIVSQAQLQETVEYDMQ